jgi:hypothetical protein
MYPHTTLAQYYVSVLTYSWPLLDDALHADNYSVIKHLSQSISHVNDTPSF